MYLRRAPAKAGHVKRVMVNPAPLMILSWEIDGFTRPPEVQYKVKIYPAWANHTASDSLRGIMRSQVV